MHAVIGRVRGLDRKEGAGPHMQRHPLQCDAAGLQGGNQLRREMQTRGRRRDRAFRKREHGLIVVAVTLIGLPPRCDIGRQRHAAALLERLVEHRAVEREGERHFAALALLLDFGIELAEQAHPAFGAEADDVAWRRAACRA